MYYLKFICTASSADINKKAVVFLFLFHIRTTASIRVFSSTLLAFYIGGSRTTTLHYLKQSSLCYESTKTPTLQHSRQSSLWHKRTAGSYCSCYKEFHLIFHYLYLTPSHFHWLSFELSKLLYWLIYSRRKFIYTSNTFTISSSCHFSSIQ